MGPSLDAVHLHSGFATPSVLLNPVGFVLGDDDDAAACGAAADQSKTARRRRGQETRPAFLDQGQASTLPILDLRVCDSRSRITTRPRWTGITNCLNPGK